MRVWVLLLAVAVAILMVSPALSEESVVLKVRADPCVTVTVFDLTSMAPVSGEREGEWAVFRVPKGHSVEVSARADGSCRVTGILEVDRNLVNQGDRTFWTATYDAEFEVRVEKPSVYVRVTADPPECLSEVFTEPMAKVELANGTAVAGPFYRDSAVRLTVEPEKDCEVMELTSPDLQGSYRASSINLWLRRDVEVTVRFRSERGSGAPMTTPKPSESPRAGSRTPEPPFRSVPLEALLPYLVVLGGAAGFAVVLRTVRTRRLRRALEVEASQSLIRQWVRRGRTSSVVLGLLSSTPALEPYGVEELLRAASRGTVHFDALNLYHRGSPFLLTNLAFEVCNSDELLALHLSAHLVAAGLIPADVTNRIELRSELIPRWARLIREGKGAQAEEEARAFVRKIRDDPTEVQISEKLREVEAERHPFAQELIDAAYRELGLEVIPEAVPVEVEVRRPVEQVKPQEPEAVSPPEVQEMAEVPEPAPVPAGPMEAPAEVPPPPSEVELKGPEDFYQLVKKGKLYVEEGVIPIQIVGGAVLIAAMAGEREVLEAIAETVRSAYVVIAPPDLNTDAVYYPAEIGAAETAVARLAGEGHLACLVADVVGGTPIFGKPGEVPKPVEGSIIVDMGVEEDVVALASVLRENGLPVRVATYSKERAIRLASILGVKAVGIRGLPEAEAALLLEAVGPLEPRLFIALTGASLLVPELRIRLVPPVTKESLESAASPPSCHIIKGLVPIVKALERITSGKEQKTVQKALEIEMGERAADAATLLELRWVDPAREGVVEVEVLELKPAVAEPSEGLAVQPEEVAEEEEGRTVGPEELVNLMEKGLVVGAEADEVSVGRAAIEAAKRGRESFSAFIGSLSAVTVRRFELSPGTEVRVELPPEILGLILRTVGRRHLKCLARLVLPGSRTVEQGGVAVLDPLGWVAGRLALLWNNRGLPPNPDLFLAMLTTSILLPCVLEALEKSTKLDSLGTVEMMPEFVRMKCCHEIPPALRTQLAGIIKEVSIGTDYTALRERYGEVASVVLFRSAVRRDSPSGADWVKIAYDGGYRVEVDGSSAPQKAIVILLNEDIYAPPLFPVSSDLPVDKLGAEGAVIRFSALNVREAMKVLMGSKGKVILVGFASYEKLGELPDVRVVECHLNLRKIAEQAASLRLPVNFCTAYPQVLMASGPEEVEEILSDLLSGTGFEGLVEITRRYMLEGKPVKAVDADKGLVKVAKSLGLLE